MLGRIAVHHGQRSAESGVGFRGRDITTVAMAFLLTVAVRLVPVLRGGGLRGFGSYDDAVYYASAVGLVHDRLPYRDFLLLQPPGVIVMLAPFAALGRIIGEANGMATARLAWMIMGGLTAVGIAIFLRPLGRLAAMAAAMFYAFFGPAAMTERGTYLEAPQSLLMIITVLLLFPVRPGRAATATRLVAVFAGLALGIDLGTKIWTLMVVVAVLGWLAIQRRFTELAWLVPSMVAAALAVYLPFFLAAPVRMWRMVVLDQLGRARYRNWTHRLADITGTSQPTNSHLPLAHAAIPLALTAMAVSLVLAFRVRHVRPVALLYVLLVGLLIAVPPTFVHYGALIGVPAAILVGTAVSELARLARKVRMPWRPVPLAALGIVVVLALTAMAYPQATARVNHPMLVGRLASALHVPGCISFDSPSPALSLGLVDRNLDRGCPLMVDLGGLGDQLSQGTGKGRSRNHPWQRVARRYLGSGVVVVLYRINHGLGADRATRRVIDHWPVIARSHGIVIRRPPHVRAVRSAGPVKHPSSTGHDVTG